MHRNPHIEFGPRDDDGAPFVYDSMTYQVMRTQRGVPLLLSKDQSVVGVSDLLSFVVAFGLVIFSRIGASSLGREWQVVVTRQNGRTWRLKERWGIRIATLTCKSEEEADALQEQIVAEWPKLLQTINPS